MSFKKELYRKSIHISTSIIPILYLFSSKSFTLEILIPIMVLFVLLDIMRFNVSFINRMYTTILKDIMRVKEEKRFTGATNLLIASVVVILLYDKPIAVSGLLFLTVSDSVAALVGKRFGKIRIYDKTLEGSLAFLLTSIIIIILIKSIDFTTGICGAFTATFVELTVTVMDDNLSIPLFSGLIMQLFSTFLL